MGVTTVNDRTGRLFSDDAIAETPQAPPDLLTAGPSLRVVYWEPDEHEREDRPCLVRCDGGERNVVSIRKLVTICGLSCSEAASTSAIEPLGKNYCNACLAGAGRGVLR